MRKIMSYTLIVTGIVFIAIAAYQYVDQKMSTSRALEEAQLLISQQTLQTVAYESKASAANTEANDELVQDEESEDDKIRQAGLEFDPETNDVIGILHIPKLEKSLPIIEGADEETLKSGVGRLAETAFPGEDEQILLSGHRDTVFRNFGELEVGDTFIVEMPYGTFEYVMDDSEIVGADDTTVIGPKGEEVLTLSTCYPFRFIGNAPDRYIIYAYPN